MKTIISLLAIIIITACSSGPNTSNLLYLNNSKSKQTEDFINNSYKTSGIYLDYGAALIVNVIYKDLEYRTLFLRELSQLYFLDKEVREELWEEDVKEYQNFFEFLVTVYSRDNRKVDFGEKNSQWRVVLWDNENYKLAPSSITKISSKNKEKLFLDKYLYPLDRWSEVYSIKFPKYNRFDAKKKQQFRLFFSGIKGQTALIWPSAKLFYQNSKNFKISF